jgi:hypothetical protein
MTEILPVTKQDVVPKFKLSEIGIAGLRMFGGVSVEEFHSELQWPKAANTYKKMMCSVPISGSLMLYQNLSSKVSWRVKPVKDATEEETKQAEFIEECLNDMETPFRKVVQDALSSNVFGFAILEKVYRRRNKSSGSIYNDNKIALKKLALRNQETIYGFVMSDDNSDVLGVKQNVNMVNGYKNLDSGTVVIPRNKFLHITTGNNRNDPFGRSPLRNVYIAWRYLEALSEMEAQGISKDLVGLPVMRVPAQLLSPDADDQQRITLENLKQILRNLQSNSQSGIMLPSAMDETTKTPLFDLELLTNNGGQKSFDLNEIKNYYQNQIYTGLFADVLILGTNGVGSFALGQVKNSLTGTTVESILDNFVDAFNRDVIRQLYELNGWDVTRCCSLDYENLHSADLETLSKFWQRVASVGLVEKDRAVLNSIRTSVGIDPYPDDEEPNLDLITPETTRSGDGMQKGSGNGTSDSVAGTDTSSKNLDNSA